MALLLWPTVGGQLVVYSSVGGLHFLFETRGRVFLEGIEYDSVGLVIN